MDQIHPNDRQLASRAFILWWTAATVVGHVAAVGALLAAMALFRQFVVTLLIPAGAITVAVCQGVIIQRYVPGIGWWKWTRATLLGLGAALLAVFAVTFPAYALLRFGALSGYYYLPYSIRMLILGVVLLALIGALISIPGWIALRQWQALGPHPKPARSTRTSWILMNIGIPTAAVMVAGVLYFAATGRTQTSASPEPSVLVACAILAGMITGCAGGVLLARTLQRHEQDEPETKLAQ